jgi:preprotein translocase subunit SecG
MNKKTIIIIIAVVLVIIVGIILLSHKKEYNKFTFPSTIQVENNSNNKMLDTTLMVVLNKIMLFDTMTVKIFPYNGKLDTRETELAGYIVKNPFEKHSYMLYVKNNLDEITFIDLVSHESLHLKQMEDFKLTVYELGYMWKGDIRSFKEVKYEDRPYEIEAYNEQVGIKTKLLKLLYK